MSNHARPRDFVEMVLEQQGEDADFSNTIILSDKTDFDLDGFVNQ